MVMETLGRLAPIVGAATLATALAACDGAPPERAQPPATGDLTWRSVELTVGSAPQQRFAGFGFSFEQDNPYPQLSEAQKAEVDRLLFQDLDTRIVRLWYGPGNPEPVRDIFQAGGVIEHARRNGVEVLLLGPWRYVGDPEEHARVLADDIRTMRTEYGIPITATGVINEPGASGANNLPVEHYVPLAVAVRREFDRAGLGDITLLGPEFASADHVAVKWSETVEADPRALDAVDALATHSYNMAATRGLAEWALRHDKQYWMTEAGGPHRDGSAEFDYGFGASAASRFLNDLNNGVTHWVWFVGLGEGAGDVYQKLLMCEGRCAGTGRIYKNYSYHYMQQITSGFPPGTVLRHVTSDLPDFRDMVWTYGAKPPLHAAAGVRPDGRWVLAAVNHTPGGGGQHSSFEAPANYRVTFVVPELAGRPSLTFELCRTNPEVAVQCGETVALTNGRATLEVAHLELITLVARQP
jgi:hypothetical protein